MSANELTKALKSNHPIDGEKSFSVCASIGKFNEIKPAGKEIGLGASLFLLQTRAIANLFLVLSIINLPVYFFFYASDVTVPSQPTDYLLKFSMGNIGMAELSCESTNFATEIEIILSCKSKFAKLTEIKFVGLVIDDDS